MLGKEVFDYIDMHCYLYCEQRNVYHGIVCKVNVIKNTVHLRINLCNNFCLVSHVKIWFHTSFDWLTVRLGPVA